MKEQQVIHANKGYEGLLKVITEKQAKKILLVNGGSIRFLRLNRFFSELEERSGIGVVHFSDFEPNPAYHCVVKGVDLFRREGCDLIVAVGGGSAIDAAKCIKLFSGMEPGSDYLTAPIVPNRIPLMAIPTTAGSGSEATRYAIIYVDGEKITVTDDSCIPDYVVFDPGVLDSLPAYQKASAMMDILCHAIESFWSVSSTETSRNYSLDAIRTVIANRDKCLNHEEAGNLQMLTAANTAGKAINITKTTAAHAMCYKITSLYGFAHGHAVAVCLGPLWRYMLAHMEESNEPRGIAYLEDAFQKLALAMGCKAPMESVEQFERMLKEYNLPKPLMRHPDELDVLVESVNLERIDNTPVKISKDTLKGLYKKSVDC